MGDAHRLYALHLGREAARRVAHVVLHTRAVEQQLAHSRGVHLAAVKQRVRLESRLATGWAQINHERRVGAAGGSERAAAHAQEAPGCAELRLELGQQRRRLELRVRGACGVCKRASLASTPP